MVDLLLRGIRVGSLTVIDPSGHRRRYGHGTPEATIHVHSERAWPQFLRGSLGLADAYAEELWDSPDLVAVIRVAAKNMPYLDRLRRWALPLTLPLSLLRAGFRPHGKAQRRRDVAQHYDLGNQLFSLMLDPTLTYSCALFETPDMPLEEAQLAKLERICERLELGPSDRVLEIGTGWGSFALYAARTRGCHITTTTISNEQYRHASDAVSAAGLNDRVTVLNRDYSELQGRYDKLVSIEMIEAVGWRRLGHFLSRCSQLLEPHGAMLLQAITVDDYAYPVERASSSFIKDYIFPGGSLPSLSAISQQLARGTDLQIQCLEDITSHYAQTLRCWREEFLTHSEELEALGYDRRFRRIWEMYLAYCEGGFTERRITDIQVLLVKPKHPAVGAFRPRVVGVEANAA